jgi:hypothetical protein
MLHDGLIRRDHLLERFREIEPKLIRYPSLDPGTFRAVVDEFCNGLSDNSVNIP